METQLATKLFEHLQEPLTILAIITVLLSGWIVKLYLSIERERQSWNSERQRLQADNKEMYIALKHALRESQSMGTSAFQTLGLLISNGGGRHGND
jgi:hypothetical protein